MACQGMRATGVTAAETKKTITHGGAFQHLAEDCTNALTYTDEHHKMTEG